MIVSGLVFGKMSSPWLGFICFLCTETFREYRMMQDHFGRSVSYVRISVTDRCNLRCFYCRSLKDWKFIPHEQILRYEEMIYLINILKEEGVAKIRFTGGEPFARRDFVPFLEELAQAHPELHLHITTNGTLIRDSIHILKDIGISGLNISLDTLRRDRFEKITGRNFYDTVRASIDRAIEAGLRTKINVVALRGVNDDELPDFVRFARDYPVDLRFIEFMPIGGSCPWKAKHYWSATDIKQELAVLTDLVPERAVDRTHGPARMFGLPGGKGRIGVISALSDHFCDECNRLRITSEGKIRPCLFSDQEYPLLPLLRKDERNLAEIRSFLHQVTLNKPMGYTLLQAYRDHHDASVCNRMMSTIGG